MTHRLKTVPCKSCDEYIVFLEKENGGFMPVDADSVNETDEFFDPVVHISHFATCPKADRHRRKPRTLAERKKRAADRKVWGP